MAKKAKISKKRSTKTVAKAKAKTNSSSKKGSRSKEKETSDMPFYITWLSQIFLAFQSESKRKNNKSVGLRGFAQHVGLEFTQVSRILTGKRRMTHENALRVLDAVKANQALRKKVFKSIDDDVRSGLGRASFQMSQAASFRQRISKTKVNDYKRKKFFVTAAELGADPHVGFLKAIDSFCDKENANLIVLPGRPHLKALQDKADAGPLADVLVNKYKNNIYTDFVFNEYLRAIELEINPQSQDPLTGINWVMYGGQSIIVASPKQRMKIYPTGNTTRPKIAQATGTCTMPHYRENNRGRVAEFNHVIGGLVVEVDGNKFYMRVVQAAADGSFIDLGKRYHARGKVVDERAEAVVVGDYHCGFEDLDAEKFVFELIDTVSPKRVLLHDFNDAASVTHHRVRTMSSRLNRPENVSTLAAELDTAKEKLELVKSNVPNDCEIMIVASNHPDHLTRYIDERRFVDDEINFRKAIELADAFYNKGQTNLIKYCIDPDETTATWLNRYDDIRVEGVHISNHGDLGSNGSRGSARGNAVALENCMVGHSHTPEIFHGAFVVGTTSLLQLDYNVGPSSWMHCSGVIYKGGSKQLVIAIDGSWRLKKSK